MMITPEGWWNRAKVPQPRGDSIGRSRSVGEYGSERCATSISWTKPVPLYQVLLGDPLRHNRA